MPAAAILLAQASRHLLRWLIGDPLPLFFTLFPATALVAFVGLWPGIVTTLLGVLLVAFWNIPNEPHLRAISTAHHLLTLSFNLLFSLVICWFAERYRQNREKAGLYDRERQMRASQNALRRYELFSRFGTDIIFFVDAPTSRILEANQAAIESYGYTRDELLRLTIYDIRTSDGHALAEQQMNTARAGGILFQATHHRKDGSTFPVEVSSRGVDIDGEQLIVSIVRDISERKRTEQALIRSEKLAAVGRIVAAVAHEINNPLEAVTNAIYLAQMSLDKPEEIRRYLSIADEELRRTAHITRQVLGFYREGTAPRQVAFQHVLASAIDLLASKIRARKAQIHVRCHGNTEARMVDGELRQILSNLLVNSLDAIEPGGAIRVHITRTWSERLQAECIRTTVGDDGSGIAHEHRTHIFEPLFTTKESTGTGLGLWVSRQIVEKYGGIIRVRSRCGTRHGTAISFLLPCNAAEEPAAAMVNSMSFHGMRTPTE